MRLKYEIVILAFCLAAAHLLLTTIKDHDSTKPDYTSAFIECFKQIGEGLGGQTKIGYVSDISDKGLDSQFVFLCQHAMVPVLVGRSCDEETLIGNFVESKNLKKFLKNNNYSLAKTFSCGLSLVLLKKNK